MAQEAQDQPAVQVVQEARAVLDLLDLPAQLVLRVRLARLVRPDRDQLALNGTDTSYVTHSHSITGPSWKPQGGLFSFGVHKSDREQVAKFEDQIEWLLSKITELVRSGLSANRRFGIRQKA